MVKKFSRAQRRHDRARMYQRAKRYQRLWWYAYPEEDSDRLHVVCMQLRDNLKICSCQMCRNPRNSWWTVGAERLTMQERREEERFEYELQEVLDINSHYGKEYRTDS